MATLRRLSPTQLADDRGQVPSAQHGKSSRPPGRLPRVQQVGSTQGYLQVPVAAADIAKTAIITPFGLFEFTRMLFGIRNAGMTFQRLMDTVLGGLSFAFVYLDDILVASPDEKAHWLHLQAVFSVLQKNGLIVNPEKCLLACSSVDFLGHRLSASGIGPLPSRVQAIAELPRPATVKQLQAFLGLFNFYHRFIPAAAKVVRPLTGALRGGPRVPPPCPGLQQW
jgi:hypothetical protein